MNNTKNTKRALLASLVSILLCVSMLIGSTFAWFTDTATTGVNKIQAGTLSIDLLDDSQTSLDGKELHFIAANGEKITSDQLLWEPGATYKLEEVTLVNDGNLAVKYKIALTLGKATSKNGKDLTEVIDVIFEVEGKDVNMGTLKTILESNGGFFNEGTLAPKGDAENKDKATYGTVKLHMQETAGNDYQGLELTDLALTVAAAQLNVEQDSIGPDYDKDAVYPVVTMSQLKEQLENENIKNVNIVGGNYNETVIVPEGKVLTAEDGTFAPTKNWFDATLNVEAGAEVILNGGNYLTSGQQIINVQVAGAKIAINGGSFKGSAIVWNCGNSEVVINGGEFNVWAIAVTDSGATNPIIINGGNFILGYGGFTAGTSVPMIINGGTFNADPTPWLGEGHTVVVSGETWTVQ